MEESCVWVVVGRSTYGIELVESVMFSRIVERRNWHVGRYSVDVVEIFHVRGVEVVEAIGEIQVICLKEWI